jgi:hypothetical protein
MKLKLAFLFLIVTILCNCENLPEGQPKPPLRPAHVPLKAIWRGGLDGGNWIFCEKSKNNLLCEYFFERSDISYRQVFKLCSNTEYSDWVDYVDGSGNKYASINDEAFFLLPISPPVYYRDNRIDKKLTEEEQRIYSRYKSDLTCRLELNIP